MNLNSIIGMWAPKKNTTLMSDTSKDILEPSLDLAFSLSQSSVDFQFDQVDKLDAKADSAQVSATTLISAALVLETVLIPMNSSKIIHIIQLVLLLPLLIAYIVVMITTRRAYKVANYKRTPAPSAFIDGYYLKMQEHEVKDKILNALAHVFEENQKIIEEKTSLINKAITWRTIEAMMLVLLLLVQVILTLITQLTT